MSDVLPLLARCRELGATLTPAPNGKLKVRAPAPLPEALREELKRRKVEVLALLNQQDAFLTKHVPSPVLEVFPTWQGLLIKSSVLEMSMWVVRSRKDGEELARETGQPALLLDDVLAQKGRSREEVRTALLPLLILGTVQ